MGEDFKDKAAAALRTGGARARVLSYQAQEKIGTLAHLAEVGGRRSFVVADRYARHAAQSAVVAGRRLNEEYSPAVQGYAHRLTVKYGFDDMFALRALDDAEEFREAMGPQSEVWVNQLQEMPLPAVPAVTIVVLRAIKSWNVTVSEVIHQRLCSRTKFARFSLLAAVVPGWVALLLYRRALLESRPLGSEHEEWTMQLARDVRRLPGAFWLPFTVSATITLQAAKEISTATVRRAFQIRKRTLMTITVLYLLVKHHGERAAAIFESVRGRLPPEAVEVFEQKWKLLQAIVRDAARRLEANLQVRFGLSGGLSNFAGRGSVDRDAIDSHGSATTLPARATPIAEEDGERN